MRFVFPSNSNYTQGLTLLEWYATFAPEPDPSDVAEEYERDKTANPHGDSYKPKRRGKAEIIADLKFQYAEAMVKASEQRAENASRPRL